jgi:hypothetical protein
MDNPISINESRAAALTRAADSMIQSLGAGSVAVRLSMAAAISGPALSQLTEDIALAPVHIRQLPKDSNGRRRYELLVSATALGALCESRSADDVNDMMTSAIGVVHDDQLLRVTDVSCDQVAGVPYLYRIVVVE